MKSENYKVALGYVLICLIWGSTWMAISIGLKSLTPIISVGIRFLIASMLIYGVMKLKHVKLQTDSLSIKLYIVLALFAYSIPYAIVYWAELYISSGLTSIVFSVMPLFVILLSLFVFSKESVSATEIIGSITGFAGIVIIFSENLSLDLSKQMLGIIAVLVSAAMQGGIAVAIKKYGNHLNPLSMNFLPMFAASIMLITAAFVFEDSSLWTFSFASVISIAYLALVGTVIAFTTYYWLLKRISVVMLSLSSFITPIIAVLLGWFFLNEKLSMQAILGSCFVLIGILFANFRGIKNYYNLKTFSR
jgi:drug/metabolite transporter (DMT)-like permease